MLSITAEIVLRRSLRPFVYRGALRDLPYLDRRGRSRDRRDHQYPLLRIDGAQAPFAKLWSVGGVGIGQIGRACAWCGRAPGCDHARAYFASVHAPAAAYACGESGSAGLRHACRAQARRHGDVATTMNYTALALLDVARALDRAAQGRTASSLGVASDPNRPLEHLNGPGAAGSAARPRHRCPTSTSRWSTTPSSTPRRWRPARPRRPQSQSKIMVRTTGLEPVLSYEKQICVPRRLSPPPLVVWTVPSPWPERFRHRPPSLYTCPLKRAWLGIGLGHQSGRASCGERVCQYV